MNEERLYVNHREMAYIMESAALSEPEFLTRIYGRWSHLEKLVPGTLVRVILEREAGTQEKKCETK